MADVEAELYSHVPVLKASKSFKGGTFFYAIPFLIKMVFCKWFYDTYKYYGYQSSLLK